MASRVRTTTRAWHVARSESLALLAAAALIEALLWPQSPSFVWWERIQEDVWERLSTLATVFLGIFLESVPFLLFGVLVSAVLQVYVSGGLIERVAPRRGLLAAVFGGSLGAVLPACECGAVPIARRLLAKGSPLSLSVAFILAAPIVNPLVLFSTWSAFSFAPGLVVGRLAIALTLAVAVGWVFHLYPGTARSSAASSVPPFARPLRVMRAAADEFLELAPYLVVGGLVAAALQTLVPRSALTALGHDPVMSVLAMMLLAALMSVCSSVDAFVALSFSGTFNAGALLAFMLLGPIVNLKSAALYTTLLRRPAMLAMIFLCGQVAFLVGVVVNLNLV
jgi:uncharacterized protein